MPSNAQIAAVIALKELGQTEDQIATTVGLEIGDVATIISSTTFGTPYVPPPSSGSGSPTNWALLTPAVPAPLTPDSHSYYFMAADLAISSQSGSDFSIVTDVASGSGAVRTAGGGRFKAAAYLEQPSAVTIDGTSAAQRWLQFQCVTGSDDAAANPISNLSALSAPWPITPGTSLTDVRDSALGYSLPGDAALWGLNIYAYNLSGTDSIPLDNVFGYPMILLYQV